MKLEGKTAIVTGGASGFGAAITARLVGEGASVAILDLKGVDGAPAAGAAMQLRCDVADEAQATAAVEEVTAGLGSIDVLINNAGWSYVNKPAMQNSVDEVDRVLHVNIRSVFLMTRAVVPGMRGRGGSIVNISSGTALRSVRGLTWYAATKAAINSVTTSLALELGPEGIRVNAVAPGLSGTALFGSFVGMPDTEANREIFAEMNPMRRLAKPSDVAEACAFLASDAAGYVNGAVLPVDGGASV